jgi:hypothetical protein
VHWQTLLPTQRRLQCSLLLYLMWYYYYASYSSPLLAGYVIRSFVLEHFPREEEKIWSFSLFMGMLLMS